MPSAGGLSSGLYCAALMLCEKSMPTLVLNRLETWSSIVGSMLVYDERPPSPFCHWKNRYGVIVLRPSPSIPSHPPNDGELRIAGPPREQTSQYVPPELKFWPKCSQMFFLSCI